MRDRIQLNVTFHFWVIFWNHPDWPTSAEVFQHLFQQLSDTETKLMLINLHT